MFKCDTGELEAEEHLLVWDMSLLMTFATIEEVVDGRDGGVLGPKDEMVIGMLPSRTRCRVGKLPGGKGWQSIMSQVEVWTLKILQTMVSNSLSALGLTSSCRSTWCVPQTSEMNAVILLGVNPEFQSPKPTVKLTIHDGSRGISVRDQIVDIHGGLRSWAVGIR